MLRTLLIFALALGGVPAAGASEPLDRPLVWIVDGAGDLKGCSKALTHANALAGNGFEFTVFPWSHGYRRLLLDQVHHAHAKEQGAKLAASLAQVREAQPGRRLVLVAHSAGCAVALAACAKLPPGTLDRVVLLAPSVSCGYDVRPCLPAARGGFDVFCSHKDRIALGLVLKVVRTTDSLRSSAAAGRYGFESKRGQALTTEQKRQLRHHFWAEDQAWTGHKGGHHGMHEPDFVTAYIFPLLASDGTPLPPPPDVP